MSRKSIYKNKRTFMKVCSSLLAASLLMPAVGPVHVKAEEGNIYMPPGGVDWSKLRDIAIDNYAWGYGNTAAPESYKGQQALKVETSDWWAAQYTTNGWQTFDFSRYAGQGTLEFDAVGLNGGEAFTIGFRDTVHERRVNGEFYKDGDADPEETNQDAMSKNVNEYKPLTTEWQHYSIPLKEIFDSNPIFDGSKVQLLKLAGVTKDPVTFWVSNIKVVSPDREVSADPIKVNQVGYLQHGEKYALVSGYYDTLNASVGTPFQVKRVSDNEEVYSGALSLAKAYDPLSGEKVLKADFTPLQDAGDYYLTVEGVSTPSVPFHLGAGVYTDLLKDVQKFFYYQRANVDLSAEHAGIFARTGLHKQDSELPLESNPNVVKDVSGGWWDAGDTGKYVTAGATAVSDLLWAYETYPNLFTDNQLNIPESRNGIPDLLDEIKIETDFFLKMQDAATGGFYAYVNREPVPNRFIMDGTGGSSVIPTAQTANTVGALAHASLVFRTQNTEQDYASKLLEAAVKGWNYLEQHPEYIPQPDGPYNDDKDQNDRFYAAAALYRATGESKYGDYVRAHYQEFEGVFKSTDFSHGINGMEMIGYYHYLSSPQADPSVRDWFASRYQTWREAALNATLNQAVWRNSTKDGFYWGANANVASMPMSLAIGSRILGTFDEANIQAAASNLNYLLGINPLQLSYITGYGENRIHITHHAIFMRDFNIEMPNGYMVGGPNNWKAKFPAKAYNASTVDWETNEQALNYNSPLIYLTAMLDDAKLSESITLSRVTDTIQSGQQTTVEATVQPNETTAKQLSVVAENPAVAAVKDVTYNADTGKTTFKVEAKSVGNTRIAVSSKDGRLSTFYNVTVVAPQPAPTPNTQPSGPVAPAPTAPAAPSQEPKPVEKPVDENTTFNPNLVQTDKLHQKLENALKPAANGEVSPVPFTDVKGHWAERALIGFAKLGVINGYSDRTLKPDAKVSRAEFAVMLDRLFDLEADAARKVSFVDVEGKWGSASIQKLASLGILNGYGDGSFQPAKTLTRQEAIVVVSRLLDLRNPAKNGPKAAVADLNEASSFAVDAIEKAAEVGLVRGGEFRPQADSTRAETLQVLWNMLSLDPELKALLDSL